MIFQIRPRRFPNKSFEAGILLSALGFILISYNKDTVKGTAASRVFCHLKPKLLEWESKWPDAK